MRTSGVVLVALLLAVAGCASPLAPAEPQETSTDGPTATAGGESATEDPGTNGTAPAGTGDTERFDYADPASDHVGWEGGYWYNESIDVDNTDGLNDSEFEKVFARTQARVEVLRQKEFVRNVTVKRVTPDQIPGQVRPDEESPAFMTFEDVRYEALFQVGENESGREVFWSGFSNRGAFYDYWNNTAVLVVSDREHPKVLPQRLSHELAHALQHQHFNLTEYIAHPTMDGSYARRAIVEGDAKLVGDRYAARCKDSWRCVVAPELNASTQPHLGLYALQLVWYEHGMAFLHEPFRNEDGWKSVNEFYRRPPSSTEQILHQSRYPDDDPVAVSLNDSTRDGWERVRPGRGFPYQKRPAYARNGQAALATMFAQTVTNGSYDRYNSSGVLNSTTLVNDRWTARENIPHANFTFPAVDGWEGDRLHAYERGNETAYVWRIVWDSPGDADEFLGKYRDLLAHWGGTHVGDDTWQIAQDSPYTDAIRIHTDGETITIVNAPEQSDLGDVYSPG